MDFIKAHLIFYQNPEGVNVPIKSSKGELLYGGRIKKEPLFFWVTEGFYGEARAASFVSLPENLEPKESQNSEDTEEEQDDDSYIPGAWYFAMEEDQTWLVTIPFKLVIFYEDPRGSQLVHIIP